MHVLAVKSEVVGFLVFVIIEKIEISVCKAVVSIGYEVMVNERITLVFTSQD